MTAPIVELTGIRVEFSDQVTALDDVDFRLFPGEVHALMGENGAGKSTLIGVLTGTCAPVAGRVVVAGYERRFSGVADARAAGIATVFQETQLGPTLSVAENVMLGRERRGRFGIDWRRTRADAADALARLGLDDMDPRTPMALLSPAQKQLVALARSVVDDPRVVLPPKEDVYTTIEATIQHFKIVMEGIKVPAGECYSYSEAGNGELGFYLVSDGSGTPYRVRIRPPSFILTSGLHHMIEGGMIADIVPTFGSINMIGGECDH